MNTANRIDHILCGMRGIRLAELQSASLMRRKDNKYLFSFLSLDGILEAIGDHYRVLEIEGQRSQHYRTVYYDTASHDMYHRHHRGMANRYKVRFRRYLASDEVFLEVKHKDAKGITRKKRIPGTNNELGIRAREEAFLGEHTPFSPEAIGPVMENHFRRITLVRDGRGERLTLDYGLGFRSLIQDRELDFPGISVAEIKYQGHLASSPVHLALRSARITPGRFSKYCIGMAMLHPELKQNRFREKAMRVGKINTHYLTHQKN